MVLVDTSVLIGYLKGLDNKATDTFQHVLDAGIPFGITSLIYQEVLQGVKSKKEFASVKEYLDTQKFYSLRDHRESYAAAATIYYRCRRRGITIQSTVDCLIAQTALENNLYLLHDDVDFVRMQGVVKLRFLTL